MPFKLMQVPNTPLLYNSRLTVAGKIKGVEILSVVNAHDMSLI